jgi:hypothetical protein
MKKHLTFVIVIFVSLIFYKSNQLYAQDDVAIVAPTTEAGENLDLMAVLEIFNESESVEDFEKKLNEEGTEVNNIDLNEDGEVDYIRVVEYVEGNTHVIVLQATIGENQYQDVASIVLEKNDQGDISAQAIGDEEIYGEDYIVESVEEAEVQTIVVVTVVYSPGYQPYVSPYGWGRYPAWYRTVIVVAKSSYNSRMKRYRKTKYRQAKARRSPKGKSMYAKNRKSSPMIKTGPSKQQKKKQQPSQQPKKQQPGQQQKKQQPALQQNKQQPGQQQKKQQPKQQQKKKTSPPTKKKKKNSP